MSVAIIMLFLLVLLALVLVYLQQTPPHTSGIPTRVKTTPATTAEVFGDWWGPWIGKWWVSGGNGAQSFYGPPPSGCARPKF